MLPLTFLDFNKLLCLSVLVKSLPKFVLLSKKSISRNPTTGESPPNLSQNPWKIDFQILLLVVWVDSLHLTVEDALPPP